MTRADTDEMTLGEFMDVIIAYNEIVDPPKGNKKDNVRTATQADFDAF